MRYFQLTYIVCDIRHTKKVLELLNLTIILNYSKDNKKTLSENIKHFIECSYYGIMVGLQGLEPWTYRL